MYANPYMICVLCGGRTVDFDRATLTNIPCGHRAEVRSRCHTWGPVDGCLCEPKHPAPELPKIRR